ncbi:MAG: hypothetical protein V3W32_11285 [Gemmatimonadota bacterium]
MLGETVLDGTTGYEGIATERVESMHGHVRYCVERKGDAKAKWIDADRLEIVETAAE